jgi:predicted transcriptional regulator
MTVVKRAVSFDPEVWADLQRVAEEEQIGVSTVVNRALRHELRVQRGLSAVSEWEAEHGVITDEELADADRLLDRAHVGKQVGRVSRRR